jgi:hypothetical protein
MRLKSKYVMLVALIMLTATPRALDQLTGLKNLAQARFRAELLNIFWNFTTPESRRDSARQNAEFLARMQAAATICPEAEKAFRASAARVVNRSARSIMNAPSLEPGQAFNYEWSSENHIAAMQTNPADEFLNTDKSASLARQVSALTDEQDEDLLVAGNVRGRAPFAEAAATPQIEDAIARLDLEQEAEVEARPVVSPRLPSRRELVGVQRLAQKFVQTSFQIRLPENFERLMADRTINSDALIKAHEAFAPAKTKCRVRVMRVAPEAPRLLERPAIIS